MHSPLMKRTKTIEREREEKSVGSPVRSLSLASTHVACMRTRCLCAPLSVPHPHGLVGRSSDDHRSGRVPLHPLQLLRRSLEAVLQRAVGHVEHAHRRVHAGGGDETTISGEAAIDHRVRVTREVHALRAGLCVPQVRLVLSVARQHEVGVQRRLDDAEDGIGVVEEALLAVVRIKHLAKTRR